MDKMRKPFQGVWNIIRFNWHFYVLSFALVFTLFLLRNVYNGLFRNTTFVLIILALFSTAISLLVSYYIYDLSNLYTFSWLNSSVGNTQGIIVNISAGFDETSSIIQHKFKPDQLLVLDFYNPEKHTEVSIKRARRAYPAFPDTQVMPTDHLPLKDSTADIIFAILSAHEIRNASERILFFKDLQRVLTPQGKIIVVEHLRDTVNFLAYNIGFFHFHSRQIWLHTFRNAELQVEKEIKITPFITTFFLRKNENTH